MLVSGQKPDPSHRLPFDDDTYRFYLDSYSAPSKGGKGMEGGLNWYRTRRINYEQELQVKDKKYPKTFPVLLVVPELDAALPPMLFKDTTKHLDAKQLDRRDVSKCGHFVQLEQPTALIHAVEEWISKRNLAEIRDNKL